MCHIYLQPRGYQSSASAYNLWVKIQNVSSRFFLSKNFLFIISGCFFKILYVFSHTEIMKESLEFVNSLKTPFYCWFGANLCLILSDPVDVEIVLNSKDCIDKAKAYKFFYRNGLFTAPGEKNKYLNFFFWSIFTRIEFTSFQVTFGVLSVKF